MKDSYYTVHQKFLRITESLVKHENGAASSHTYFEAL
jgi:hypothetical protein